VASRWLLVCLLCVGMAHAQPDPWQAILDGGRIARQEGQYPEARRLYAQALAEVETGDADDPRITEAVYALTALFRGWPDGGGEVYLRDVLSRWERQFGPDDARIATATEALAELLRHEPETAADDGLLTPLYARALRIREKCFGVADARLAHTLARLAQLAALGGRPAEASADYQRALRLKHDAGQQDDELARLEAGFAVFYWDARQYAEAGACWQRALAIDERLHPDSRQLATTLTQLGWAEERLGQYPSLTAHWQRAAELRGSLEVGDWELLRLLDQLAWSYTLLGNDIDAEQTYRWEWSLQERISKGTLGATALALADLYRRQGRFTDAQTLYRRADLTGTEATAQPVLLRARALAGLAECVLAQGEVAAANELRQRARILLARSTEREHGIEEARLALTLRDYARTESCCAAIIRAAGYPDAHPRNAECLRMMAKVKLAWGTAAEAESSYTNALANWESCLGATHPALVGVLLDGVTLYRALGKIAPADTLATRAETIAQRAAAGSEDGGIDGVLQLARFAQRDGKADVAGPWCEFAVTSAEHTFTPHDPRLASVFRQTAMIWRALGQPARAATQEQHAKEIETAPPAP